MKGDPMKHRLSLGLVLLFLIHFSAVPGHTALDPPTPGSSYAYPNPVRGCCVDVVYRMDEPGTAEIRVYHEGGDLVAQSSEWKPVGTQETRVGCRQAPGLYLYRVTLHYDSGRTAILPTGHFTVATR